MPAGTDIDQRLRDLPVGEPVEVEGEAVYLNIHPGGAELGAVLARSYSQVQLRDLLHAGFGRALVSPAGLGLDADRGLVLTQWLPGVVGWMEAAGALEHLLEQVAQWRAELAPGEAPQPVPGSGRTEHRIRRLIAGAT